MAFRCIYSNRACNGCGECFDDEDYDEEEEQYCYSSKEEYDADMGLVDETKQKYSSPLGGSIW